LAVCQHQLLAGWQLHLQAATVDKKELGRVTLHVADDAQRLVDDEVAKHRFAGVLHFDDVAIGGDRDSGGKIW